MSQLLKEVSFLDLPIIAKGKVREMFDLGDSILMVVTDRVSAFDVVFNELIPDKGRVLNSISAFWFAQTSHIVPNHVLTADVEEYPAVLQPHKDQLRDRSMIVKKAEMFPAECIVRLPPPSSVNNCRHRPLNRFRNSVVQGLENYGMGNIPYRTLRLYPEVRCVERYVLTNQ